MTMANEIGDEHDDDDDGGRSAYRFNFNAQMLSFFITTKIQDGKKQGMKP